MNLRTTLLALFLLPVAARGAKAAEDFHLKGGEKIVFFGDSITQGGDYVSYVEAYLRTRFPDKDFTVVNHGISSETVSGTSEPDHDPRRPDAHDRFARDVAAWKPDVLVACFGMNDGNYFPFGEERFAKYQAGVRRLLGRARAEAGGPRVTLLTPPPYDPYRRGLGDANATEYGYKFPYIGYDDVLGRYAEWLMTLPAQDKAVLVGDVHSVSNEHLRDRRKAKVSFFLAGDAVHPTPTGHWLMAQTLLLAWHAPADCAGAAVDLSGGEPKVTAGDVRGLKREGDSIAFTWRTPLPLPIDPRWDEASIESEKVGERLSRYRLTVKGLAPGRYALEADGKKFAEATADELAAGLDLMKAKEFPAHAHAAEVLRLLQQKRQGVYADWRKRLATPDPADDLYDQDALPESREPLAKVRELCEPKEVEVQIKRAAG